MRLLLLGLVLLCFSHTASAQDAPYRLHAGDIIDVSLWKEEGMQREVLVLPDGTISFPLAGQVEAAGRTAGQVEQVLAERLQKYYPDPFITVSVLSTAGNSIFVIGEVQNPGQFLAVQPLDVMQALSLAGGLRVHADESEIKILRRRDGEQTAIPFSYGDVQTGRDLNSNIVLESGDVVVVPTRGIF